MHTPHTADIRRELRRLGRDQSWERVQKYLANVSKALGEHIETIYDLPHRAQWKLAQILRREER